MPFPATAPALVARARGAPCARWLGSAALSTLITADGAGRTSLGGLRLCEDVLLFLRDEESGALWSVGRTPLAGAPERYEAASEPGCFRILRLEHGIEAVCEIAVAPGANAELRRVRVTNASVRTRRIALTSYLALVLHDPAAHAAHPAFSKLFVQTREAGGVLLARRRPRGLGPEPPHAGHALFGPGAASFESDRARFVGRGRSLRDPAALARGGPLAGGVGQVLDPIASWRREVSLAPGACAEWLAVLAAAPGAEAAHALALRFAAPDAFEAARAGAAEAARRALAPSRLAPAEGEYLQALLGAIVCGAPALGAAPEVLARARGAPEELSALGVSPRAPLVVIENGAGSAGLVREAERARAYWRALGIEVEILPVAAHAGARPRLLDVARAAARLVLREAWPALDAKPAPAASVRHVPAASARHVPAASARQLPAEPAAECTPPPAPPELRFWNGTGGFAPDGRSYAIEIPDAGALPPLPWVNVIANPEFGTLVSERGAATTWSRNSREHRLTPWSNDPIEDPHGEALWIRDEDARRYWSPQPGPTPGPGRYEVRHGFGRTRWRHASHELEQEVWTLVAPDAPVKLTRVRLVNRAERARHLSVFSYARLVLGVLPEDARAVVVEASAGGRTLRARNGLAGAFAGGVAFAHAACDAPGASVSFTADRTAFLGAGGTPAAPRALGEAQALDGAAGARLDPCFAQQLRFELGPGASAECVLLLGEARDAAEVDALVARFARPGAAAEAEAAVEAGWARTLGALQVSTPSPALDFMLNGWLAYQTLSCRLWGRSAFSQSGGAFGYRDQLQDAGALVFVRPDLTRAQILLHAAHQFVEGDVLHWWHPPHERGTRTRFADDLLWLPYLTAQYVAVTGDRALLDEPAGFVTARALAPGEDEAYLAVTPAAESASVYEHGCRAIERSLAVGAHGLPLMGTGDWNDGMNAVGREGRGESVWMAFFLYEVLRRFEPLAEARGDADRAARWAAHRAALERALETHAWDGAWYRRAWFDDGTPLGTAAAAECRIDLLPQAWAVLSGAAPRARAEAALDAALRELWLPEGRLLRLLAPPFDRSEPSPGYIQGYLPGIRENGGQYTHAACWAVRALAELGRREQAFELLEKLLPVHHARTPEQVAVYQVEPYVVAADLYAVAPHVGRGGWTWYTGSSGWLLRVALESVLGLRIEDGRRCRLRPCVPDAWPGFTIAYTVPGGSTRYAIRVENPERASERVVALRLDGRALEPEDGAAVWPLAADGALHEVEVRLGPDPSRTRSSGR
jgi:cyclic beta-1,2-glucan synthetase